MDHDVEQQPAVTAVVEVRGVQFASEKAHDASMSMDSMVRDTRNRFLVAALFSIPILLSSPIGRDVFGFDLAAPFGLRDDQWALLLSCKTRGAESRWSVTA